MKIGILQNKRRIGSVEAVNGYLVVHADRSEDTPRLSDVMQTVAQNYIEHGGGDPATATAEDVIRYALDTLGSNAIPEEGFNERRSNKVSTTAHLGGTPTPVRQSNKPASREVALAGRDGAELAKLIREAKDHGAALFWEIVRKAVSRYDGKGPLLVDSELDQIAESLAAVNSTAELLGRSRVREMADRSLTAGGLSKFADEIPLSTFAEAPPGVIATPEAAVDYFTGLVPKLGIDPERFPQEQRRKAFTLAASTNDVLTRRVQEVITEGLREGKSSADVTAAIRDAISAAGVSPKNPQYAEMVYRTNAQDAYQTGVYEEGRHPDVADVFPVWQYVGIDDERTGADHRPKFDRFYPAHATFAAVRGNRPYNCRCSMKWIDFLDWEDLQARGARLEHRW